MAEGGAPRGPPKLLLQRLGLQGLKAGLLQAQTRGAPALCLSYGKELLDRFAAALKDEVYAVYETVYLAALTLNEPAVYERCYNALVARWGSSSKRLRGLLMLQQEAAGKHQQAIRLLADYLQQHHGDVGARRRVVATYRIQGNYKSCISFLISHLREYAGDKEAWHELAEVYIHLMLLQQAAFVWEELLMRDPNNLYYLLSYGEGAQDLVLLQQQQKQQQSGSKQQQQQQRQRQQRRRPEDLEAQEALKSAATLLALGLEAAKRLDKMYEQQLQQKSGRIFAAAARRRIAALQKSLEQHRAA
ncbi:TPR Domain containing protein, putative [Eimeria tenella]|uniref:ER membrane protein complex subunit 2 n=1 Tax=Eimeria tenella TaxID=5802 RepID=U6KMI3_EIMTE|nr:TPR Domain containing protein, putative [Eimeria tenella]CDJ38021.1 TPR Domain containing protein, putative [Eimeria tenella]|eukprot:XP_013228859.1 TPR Domain containing protein, putative [Eimeria tenella]